MMDQINSIEIPNKRYFSIGEVSKITNIKTHILRYWEKEFDTLTPVKRTGNRRYYTQNDILTILKIHNLRRLCNFWAYFLVNFISFF